MTDTKFYMRLILRRLPAMAVLFLLATAIGIVVAIRLPPIYQTTAKLLVESSQIPDELVQSTVEIDPSELLEVIQQRLMTRSNLLDIARRYDVFPDAASMSSDEIVVRMNQLTRIRRTAGRNRATLMSISFEGQNARTIANVVNQYVTIVLETNSELRIENTSGALAFFEQQAEAESSKLDLQNQKIAQFKADNADALPDNLEYRLNRQTLLQERLSRAERDIAGLEAQRANIIQVAKTTGQIVAPGERRQTADEKRLELLEGELNTALSVFSENNPKVINLRRRIDGLNAKITGASGSGDVSEGEGNAQSTVLEVSLSEIDTRIATLRLEAEEASEELDRLENSIARTPANEITLNALERDLQNIQNLYSTAVTRLSEAQMGQQIELSARGERISVIESASVPTEPFKPNRPIVAAMGAALGLGLAGGLFMLMELLNQSIRRPIDIVKTMQITPLATVPRIETLAHKRLRRIAQVASLVAVLAGVPAILWAVDTYYMPLDLLFERIMDRLV